MPKAFIIGLDALEYNIVTAFHFKTLLQKDFGKIDLTPYKMKLITPWLWSIIISGKIDTGITHFVTYESRMLRFIEKILTHPILYKKIEKIVESLRRKREDRSGTAFFFYKKGIKVRPMGKEDLKVKTIFDIIPNSHAICIPGYNLWREQFIIDLLLPLTKCIGNHKLTLKRLRLQWLLEKKKKKILEQLLHRGDWDLVMVHFYITDVVGHLYWNKPLMLLETYKIMSHWIRKWKTILNTYTEPVWILVLSDHGMRRGLHTDHAFWSSNFKLKKRPRQLTDFFRLVTTYFQNPSEVVKIEITH